jgi:hypothetical protein
MIYLSQQPLQKVTKFAQPFGGHDPVVEKRDGGLSSFEKGLRSIPGDFRLGERTEDRIEFICTRFVFEVGSALVW